MEMNANRFGGVSDDTGALLSDKAGSTRVLCLLSNAAKLTHGVVTLSVSNATARCRRDRVRSRTQGSAHDVRQAQHTLDLHARGGWPPGEGGRAVHNHCKQLSHCWAGRSCTTAALQGTTFSLFVPATSGRAGEGAGMPATCADRLTAAPEGAHTVLVIDDDVRVQMIGSGYPKGSIACARGGAGAGDGPAPEARCHHP